MFSSSQSRHLLLLALDGLIAGLSLWFAMLLRFEGEIPAIWLITLPRLLILICLARVAASYVMRVHRWSFRYSGLTDGARMAVSGLLGTGLFILAVYLLRTKGPPRSVVVLELLLSGAGLAGVRFFPRLAWLYRMDRTRARRSDLLRTVIFGAGAAGEMLLRDLRQSDEHRYRVVGFVDDDFKKHRAIVSGVPVLGSTEQLPELIRAHDIHNLLIAIPRLPAEKVRKILSLCADLKIQYKILPVSFVYLQERSPATLLQDLAPEDLLPREAVDFAVPTETDDSLQGVTALVTGGAGSIGSEISRQLLSRGVSRLVMLDMNENELYLLKRQLEAHYPKVEVITEVADVRDAGRINRLFAEHRPRDVFHAAAHKHVPLMEQAPCEAIKNNVMGTLHVATAAHRNRAARFVFISTDKAVQPSSVMGASKRVGEMLVRSLAHTSQTHFSAVRFGNVLNSAGSVVPLFREQIARGGPVTVTHPDVRRFFMTISEAVGLVLRAAYGEYGELCILEMGEQILIVDLAKHLITMAGLTPGVDIPIEFTGLRKGEKLFEELMTDEEESTRRVDSKILVAESRPPGPEFERQLERLIRVAKTEDDRATLIALTEVVPSYRCATELGTAFPEPTPVPA